MTKKLPEEYTISLNDVEVISVDCTDHLESGELIASSGFTADEVVASGFATIGTPVRNTAAYTTSATGKTVAISEAIQLTFTASKVGRYSLIVSIPTDGNPARTFKRTLSINVI